MAGNKVFKVHDIPVKGIMLNGHICARDAKVGDGSDADRYRKDDYNLQVAWGKDVDYSALKKAVLQVAKENFGFTKLSQFQHPFRQGNDNTDKDGDVRAGFADKIYIKAKTQFDISLYNKKVQLLTPEAAEELFYNGCQVVAVVTVAPYEGTETVKGADGKKRTEKYQGVACYLSAVQFAGDGDRIGGGGNARSVLQALEDDGSEDEDGFDELDDEEGFSDDDLGDDDLGEEEDPF